MPASENSILAIDCGSLTTKASLFDLVDGSYRFLAKGVSLSVNENIGESIAATLNDICSITGRELRFGNRIMMPETPAGEGVDRVVIVTSAGRPLRVAVVAVTRSYSLSVAQAVVRSVKAEIVFSTSLEDIRAAGERRSAEGLVDARPDVILVAGGNDGGATRPLIELGHFLTATKLRALDGSALPLVLSVNSDVQRQLFETLAPVFDLQVVKNILADDNGTNPKPAIDLLENIYLTNALETASGYGMLAPGEGSLVVPFTRALETVAGYLSRRHSCDATLVDVGSESISVFFTEKNVVHRAVSAGFGIGKTAYRFADQAAVDRISTWLGNTREPEIIINHLLNKSLRPYNMPGNTTDVDMEFAIIREAIFRAAEHRPVTGVVAATGGVFCGSEHHLQILAALVDALEPVGITHFLVDTLGVSPMLGAIAINDPHAASGIALNDAFSDLGTVIAPIGHMETNEMAIRARILYSDSSHVDVQVRFGETELVPLAPGEKASVSLQIAAPLSLGGIQAGRSAQLTVEGGTVGLFFDGRGRPLCQDNSGVGSEPKNAESTNTVVV